MNKVLFPYHPAVKLVGLLILACAATGITISLVVGNGYDSLARGFQAFCLGLIFIFFSKERDDDERVHQLKFQSLTWGILTAYFLSIGMTSLFRTPSMHEFLCFALLLTIALFYFRKNQ